jgi:Ca2+-binding RTX toxin-like protein
MTITYKGGNGNDVVISKTPPPTTITGTDAADLIDATHTVAGQPLPTSDADLIYGLGGGDIIAALGGDDQVEGGDGKDTIAGDGGNDWIDGGKGKDTITGGDGDDTILGRKGKDDLHGDAGNDVLKGNGKDDVLRGGDGDDVLIGGPGRNKLYGGDGNDTFVFRKSSASDKIKDYAEGDIIALAKSGFSGLGPAGTLKAKFFHVGDHAETRAQHVLYDKDSGWLLYAKNGSATANPHQLVKIGKGLDHFDHHDILVI